LRVVSTSVWNESIFNELITFRNDIHKDIITSFPETLNDYARYFSADSLFIADFSWEAFLVKEGDRVLAKAILCWRKDSTNGNLGFIDWENNLPAAELLIQNITDCAKRNSIKNLKTPVDLNFFIKYRIRTPGGGKPFWGEPIYPDYYHELFQKTGFQEIARWDTYQVPKLQGTIAYLTKRLKLAKKPSGSHSKSKDRNLRTTIRCINMNDWDNEIKIIYELFHESYKSMPEWESISFEQFKIIYDDFKYIINPLYAYIVELRGKPVGFSINFADPLPILAKYKGKKLSTFQNAMVFARLRMNQSCFLIAHVGKIPGPDGEEIKGVQIQASKRIQYAVTLMRKVLVTFQVENSPSRRSFEGSAQKPYAQYVLYGRNL
jgi:hypothetical protein